MSGELDPIYYTLTNEDKLLNAIFNSLSIETVREIASMTKKQSDAWQREAFRTTYKYYLWHREKNHEI